jgi:pyridoxamine 5'-phosphate oxidase
MSPTELLGEVDRILEESKTALLATVDSLGRPRLRWMTPRRLRGRPGHLYTVTDLGASKVPEIRHDPRVTWLVQRASLSEVITLRGRAVVVEDPSLLAEFLEAAGKDLFMVWHLQPTQRRPELAVETVIEEASRFDAGSGGTTTFAFVS